MPVARIDCNVVDRRYVDHQSPRGRVAGIGVAAGAGDDGHAVPARPQDRLAHVLAVAAARDAGGKDLGVAEIVRARRHGEAGRARPQHRTLQAPRQILPGSGTEARRLGRPRRRAPRRGRRHRRGHRHRGESCGDRCAGRGSVRRSRRCLPRHAGRFASRRGETPPAVPIRQFYGGSAKKGRLASPRDWLPRPAALTKRSAPAPARPLCEEALRAFRRRL